MGDSEQFRPTVQMNSGPSIAHKNEAAKRGWSSRRDKVTGTYDWEHTTGMEISKWWTVQKAEMRERSRKYHTTLRNKHNTAWSTKDEID